MQKHTDIRLTGIVLAGGKGMRLGRNKGLALLRGRPLIEYVIGKLSQVCGEILISSNTSQCEAFGHPTVPDIHKGKGPMAGIHACLKASSNEHNFVLSVDTPFVHPDLIRFLIRERGAGLIAAPWHGNEHYEPLCAYYHKNALPVMEQFFEMGNYKLPDLFQALPFTAISVERMAPFAGPMSFHNINTLADLALAEKYLEENISDV